MASILPFLLHLLLSCAGDGGNGYDLKPVIKPVIEDISDVSVTIKSQSINCDAVYGIALEASDKTVPSAADIVSDGARSQNGVLVISGLEKGKSYTAWLVGVMGNEYGSVMSITFTTPSLYPWESAREELLTFADMDLLPGGVSNKTPNTWNEDRLKPHVTFKDENGKEQWLHEAFLFIGGEDAKRNRILCIPDGQSQSANQDSWKDFADYWMTDGGVVDALDMTIGNAIARIGEPTFRHSVVMAMPDPIMLEFFSDKNSSTTYWGQVHGRQLDFRNTEDQVLAYKWFIDYVREAWEKAAPENLELAGFYVLSEILVAKPSGWNYQYKRWDKILPEVSKYLHSLKYTLNWIPYYAADGYDMTRQLGIDYTWLQPNKYWDYPEKKQKKYWSWVFNSMNAYGHGMEIEFEGSHGEPGWSQYESGVPRTSSSILETVRTNNDAQNTPKGSPNPQAARNKQLLRDYMNEFKNAGFYGKARIATYSGTNAMYELATSTDVKDKEMYLEYCKFIVENPLRK